MRFALALFALLGTCTAHPGIAAPDPEVADAAVRAFMARESIPAAHVTILRGDDVILQRGYGAIGADGPPPDAASIFPLGSISKQFTAAAVIALVDAGKVQLDAPVGEYLPEWFADEPDLRVLHLLSQTSGLADFLWLEGYRKLADDAATPIAAYVALAAAAPRRLRAGHAMGLQQHQLQGAGADRRTRDGPSLRQRAGGTRAATGGNRGHRAVPRPATRAVRARALAAKASPRRSMRVAPPTRATADLCGNAASLVRWIRQGFVALGSERHASRASREPNRLADGTAVPYGFGVSIARFPRPRDGSGTAATSTGTAR